MTPTKKWLQKSEEYKMHASDWEGCCSFSDEDAEAQFMSETYGAQHFFHYTRKNSDGKYNGFAVGKHWQGVMEAYYKQDIEEGNFCKAELIVTPSSVVVTDYDQQDAVVYAAEEVCEYTGRNRVVMAVAAPAWFPYQRGER